MIYPGRFEYTRTDNPPVAGMTALVVLTGFKPGKLSVARRETRREPSPSPHRRFERDTQVSAAA